MAKFSIATPAYTTSTAYKTVLIIDAGTTVLAELEVVEAIMTGAGSVAPADVGHRAAIQRLDRTTTGTITAIAANKMDARSNASAFTAATSGTATAEPTAYVAAEIVIFGFNQRGGMRWAVPIGQGILCTGSTAGVSKTGLKVLSSVAGSVDGSLIWNEA